MEDIVVDLDVVSDPESEKAGWSVLGKILAEKSLNRGVVKAILRNLWPKKEVPIIGDVGSNLVNLIFTSEEVMNRALSENPWLVMGYCLNLKFWPPDKSMREVDLDSIAFWVQIHSLPREMMVKSNAMKIGSLLGNVLEIEEPRGRFGINRSFLRVRVELKAKKALVPGVWVNRQGGDRAWAEFKYEKLSDFCFNCGRLGHSCKFCQEVVAATQKFGPFMRAPMAKQLLSPGKQRSFSWDDGKKPWEGDWRSQKVARGIVFDSAREQARGVGEGRGNTLVAHVTTPGFASASLGGAVGDTDLPAQQVELGDFCVDKTVTMDVSRRSHVLDLGRKGKGPLSSGSISDTLSEPPYYSVSGQPNVSNVSSIGLVQSQSRALVLTGPSQPECDIVFSAEPSQLSSESSIIPVFQTEEIQERAVPELEYPVEPGVPELDYPEIPEVYEPEIPEIFEAGSQEVVQQRKFPNMSPVKMIRTVMNLSNVFRTLQLKRSVGDEIELKGHKKKQRVIGLLDFDRRESDFQGISVIDHLNKEDSCLDLGRCVPQTRRKYKRKANVKGRGKRVPSTVVIREMDDLFELMASIYGGQNVYKRRMLAAEVME
ncbi:hypothetical protein COLO4_29560 [Corchorus olitorius]|uniref:CCHC-type domain-containing protein n=1 Tax=Corchorus olitorius TaxID=93759 RepID=A0A1R3HE47_9ROSI|nr:hypothetical protein COLO4_29560 [Corchorus olitorius]